ncbi:transmembrane protein [Mycobacteroides abscessus subsp. abscessus]|nr:transmembrane protein [Mycobacteroides abscessus subsp. abscessus]
MSRDKMVAAGALVIAVLAAVGSVVSWLAASSIADVAPVIPGEPVKTSVLYDPSLITLSLLLAAFAGVLAVVGTARWRRAK